MIAAVLTLWATFSLLVAGECLELPRDLARTAAGLLTFELAMLLGWSYGCEAGHACTPLGAVAGVAARTDVPLVSLLVLTAVAFRWRRRVG